MPDDLVTTEGVDESPDPKDAPAQAPEPDPAGPGGVLPDEPPASPTGPSGPEQEGPGQQLEEGEG